MMRQLTTILQYVKHPQARTIAIYTFSNFFNKGVSFLLLFYFARVLTQADFGMLSLFSNSILLLMPFVQLGIVQSINADYFKLDAQQFRHQFTTTLLLPLLVTLLAVITAFVFRHPLEARYGFPASFLLLIPAISFLTFVNEHLTNLVRNRQEPMVYLGVNMGRLLVEIGLAVFFISVLHKGWMGRVMGITVSYVLVGAYGLYYFYRHGYLGGRIQLQRWKAELIYSLPIMLMQLSIFAMSAATLYYLEHFTRDYAQVGVFSVAVTFASVIIVFCSALLQYLFPKMYALLAETPVNQSAIRKQFQFYGVAILGITGVVMLITPVVYTFFLPAAYREGLTYFFPIALGNACWAIANFFYTFLLYHKAKRNILWLSVAALAVNTVLNLVLVSTWGSMGGAWAVFGSYLSVLILTLLFVKRPFLAILRKHDH